jgi:hypothetical protein
MAVPTRLADIHREEAAISARVFVGNLSFGTTQDQLTQLMSAAGRIMSVHLPADRETGRPRGFAFVEFSNEAEAAEAIQLFNERDLDGQSSESIRPTSGRRAPRVFAGISPPGRRSARTRSRAMAGRRGTGHSRPRGAAAASGGASEASEERTVADREYLAAGPCFVYTAIVRLVYRPPSGALNPASPPIGSSACPGRESCCGRVSPP